MYPVSRKVFLFMDNKLLGLSSSESSFVHALQLHFSLTIEKTDNMYARKEKMVGKRKRYQHAATVEMYTFFPVGKGCLH